MEKAGKFWGSTSPLFNKNNVEIHRLEGVKGGYSSKHKHDAKYNMFFVESGAIKIVTWKDKSGLPDSTTLQKGDTCIVPPGLYHKFIVEEPCVAYEVYWVELNPHDIVRADKGGLNDCNN
jgi:quercetin dioxygenase-like cupin family protein